MRCKKKVTERDCLAGENYAMNVGSMTNVPSKRRSLLRNFFPRSPLQWFGVAAALGGVAAVAGGAIALTGAVNLSAVPPHPDGWAHLLHFGMSRSVAHHANQPASQEPLDSSAMVMRGATAYAEVCENCHGAPGFGQSPVALSMRPEPPMILDASVKLSDQELFFIVANGVRYTGMPAWPVQNRPDEVWAMVAFLKATPKMDGATYTRLARGGPDENAPSQGAATTPPTSASGDANAIAPFTPSDRERPYMAGDPQSPFTVATAIAFPRVGFGTVPDPSNPMKACVACHGRDGAGREGGEFPNLTLQSPQYLYDALKAFAAGQRQSGVMWPIAASLSDTEMRALAIQLGAPPAAPTRVPGGATGERARGAEIAAEGVVNPSGVHGAAPARVERCSSCHLPGSYLGRVVPRLDGQNIAYLRTQLDAFRAGGRGDTGTYNPMVSDSHNLSDADIAAVSTYYAARAPMAKN